MSFRHMFIAVLLTPLVLCGCASSGHKITRDSPKYLHAARVFGGTTNLLFITVLSRGAIDDSLVSAMTEQAYDNAARIHETRPVFRANS